MKHHMKMERKIRPDAPAADAKPAADTKPAEEAPKAEDAPKTEQPAEAEKAEAPKAEEPAVDAVKLQADLDAALALNEKYLEMMARTQADFDNFRRRNESVRADSYADGQRSVAAAMLNVLDNLERALAAATEDSALKSGVELTLKQMNAAYEKLGVTPIDRLGQKFDPELENAIMQGAPEDGEPGTVCMVLQKGYMMGKNVLRHAMVKVVPD